MSVRNCERIESLAGAIALGEATDEERREYREHISACGSCLDALGGEREIERVASTVGAARESEMWQPDAGGVVERHRRGRSRALRYSASFLGIALCASLGVHALIAGGIAHFTPALAAHPVVINAGTTRIVLEQGNATPVPAAPAKPASSSRRLIVTHNVVQIARAPVAPPVAIPAVKPASEAQQPVQEISSVVVHPDAPAENATQSNVPVWRRGDSAWRTVARTTTTSLSESAPQTLTHNAESLHMIPAREAAPVGGAAAINPQPPMIAYDEGAEGTAVFEVSIDERGTPVKCTITKSTGYPVLDATVCKAAMQTRYTPKMVGGRAVPGVYQDAFTFHMQDTQNAEALPKSIQ